MSSGRRWLPLPPVIVAMLREHQTRQAKQRDDAEEWEDNDLIFSTRNGRPINQRKMHRTWRRVTERAGVEHRGIHHLRHTYGTRWPNTAYTNGSRSNYSVTPTAVRRARSTRTCRRR